MVNGNSVGNLEIVPAWFLTDNPCLDLTDCGAYGLAQSHRQHVQATTRWYHWFGFSAKHFGDDICQEIMRGLRQQLFVECLEVLVLVFPPDSLLQ